MIPTLAFLMTAVLFGDAPPGASTPDVATIIQRSVAANAQDFKAAPQYSHKERDSSGHGTKLYQVMMIEGSPYNRLLAINGKALAGDAKAKEDAKFKGETEKRQAETAEQKQARIAKYERDRKRDQNMMNQLTEAFNFTLEGEEQMRGFRVYRLKAMPRPGYKPPNLDTEVLPAMQGELWIDTKTFQWVKVTAQVVHPASIAGFLAQVEPGTQFELEKSPVADGVWLPSHFAMKSRAKVLMMVNRSSSDNETYFDYKAAGS